MSDMMTFPDTWEEFEKSYGFTDNEEVYTNGARLIPSFRVKQWLDHKPSVHPELSNNSPKLDKEIGECNDCIKHGGDWECDRVHCHKGDVPDKNVGELISRQGLIKAIDKFIPADPMKSEYTQGISVGLAIATGCIEKFSQENDDSSQGLVKDLISRQAAIDAVHKDYDAILDFKSDGHTVADSFEDIINALPSVQPRKGKWIRGDSEKLQGKWRCSACNKTTYDINANFCPNCGCRMGEGEQDDQTRNH